MKRFSQKLNSQDSNKPRTPDLKAKDLPLDHDATYNEGDDDDDDIGGSGDDAGGGGDVGGVAGDGNDNGTPF